MIFGFGGDGTTVGLDVGSALLKVAVLDHSRDRPRLESVGIRPVEPDAIVEGEVRERRSVADGIRALLEEQSVPDAGIVSSVGGRDVIVKLIQMDRMSEEDAREVIRWEAGQHVPFEIEEVELDFEIIDPEGEGLQMTVLLVAAKQKLVEDRITLLQEAGYEPGVVDAEPFALHNALEFNHPEAMDGVVGLACIGHDRTAFNVIDDGTPVLIRDLSFGTGGLRDRLVDEHGIERDQAAALLQVERDRVPPAVRETIESEIKGLGQGVERASVFLETQADREGLGQLYLCGGGASVPGIDEILADRLGLEVRMANPVQGLDPAPGAFDSVEIEDVFPLLMPAVGMGLRKVS